MTMSLRAFVLKRTAQKSFFCAADMPVSMEVSVLSESEEDEGLFLDCL